jgi:hypothetical protein
VIVELGGGGKRVVDEVDDVADYLKVGVGGLTESVEVGRCHRGMIWD